VHAWNSPVCKHVFRIEAELSITSENLFYFFIDGVNYNDMKTKKDRPKNNQAEALEEVGETGRYEVLYIAII
jgi:hypothetical protein